MVTATMISLEDQVMFVQYFQNYMNELLNHNKTLGASYKYEIEQVLRSNPTKVQKVEVTSMIQAAKDFELGLQFFAEAQKINVKGAKVFHKRLKKIDNAFMDKQLFETDKTEVMIINEEDGTYSVAEGTDEVTRNYADYMKRITDERETILNEMKWLSKNCSFGLLLMSA